VLVVGHSDLAPELHDQSRVQKRAGGNDGQSATKRRIPGRAFSRSSPIMYVPIASGFDGHRTP